MKYLIIYLLIVIPAQAKFEMIILDKDIKNDNKVLKKIEKRPERKPSARVRRRMVFLDNETRDYYLDKFFPEYIKDMDNMDRDILYKKLMTYDTDKIKEQLEWISEEDILNFREQAARD